MIRVFNLYIPTRTLVLLAGEVAIICASFAAAILIRFGEDSSLVFNYEHGILKITLVTALTLLCSHFMEMYDLRRLRAPGETYFRILTLVGGLSFLLAGITYFFPQLLVGREVFLTGLCILSLTWISWRWAYDRLIRLPALRERIYLLGNGPRASRLVEALRTRGELGMDVVGWAGETGIEAMTREALSTNLLEMSRAREVDRVIVALSDRRGTMPVGELLDLRLRGVRVEDGTAMLEKFYGLIEIDELYPSWLIFGEGFRRSFLNRAMRRAISTLFSLTLLLIALPLIPLIILLVRISSPGPILYRQKRVGLNGVVFDCYKFRTMRADAEADSGATWASDEDPRITKIGHYLRKMRLDEIPQLWNVLKGDMGLVGPRPERPEFVNRLATEIPYYGMRHLIRPGITGWAQINFGYGASVEDAKEKLRYDLYYIKNGSLAIDLLIIFRTIRTVLLRRGAR